MERLKKLRKENKITMRELGGVLGLSETAIYYYETGKREPDQATLKKLADYFNVSVDYLLGRETPASTPLDDVEIALYEGSKGLSEQGKKDVLDYIEFIKSKEKQK